MRTTLNLDEDVLLAVQARARSEGRSAGQVLSDLARAALRPQSVTPGLPAHGFRPLPRRGQVVTDELIDRLRVEGGE